MCLSPRAPRQVAAPAASAPKILVNPFLDNDSSRNGKTVAALRSGRSSLRIDMPGEGAVGFGGTRTGAAARGAAGRPSGNLQIGVNARSRGVGSAQVDRMNDAALDRAGPEQTARREDRAERREESRRSGGAHRDRVL